MANEERMVKPLTFEEVLKTVEELVEQDREPLFFAGKHRINGEIKPMVFCHIPSRNRDGKIVGTNDPLFLSTEQAKQIIEKLDGLETRTD